MEYLSSRVTGFSFSIWAFGRCALIGNGEEVQNSILTDKESYVREESNSAAVVNSIMLDVVTHKKLKTRSTLVE